MDERNENNINLKSLSPEKRLKRLNDYSNAFQVDASTPAKRYYNSGVQMIRMADMHLKDNQYEDAFVLYMKYITLFVEKIRKHPDYKNVGPEDKTATTIKLKEVLPKAEKIKHKLLELYNAEYNEYLEEKQKEDLLLEKLKKESEHQYEFGNTNNVTLELSEGVRRTTITKDNIKPVPYLPDDFLVYEIPETKNYSPSGPVASAVTVPGIDRSTKPSQYNSYNSRSEYSSSLRTILIPSKMLNTFLSLAQKNTLNNVETCGILAGKLKQNRLIITHLLIPKQYGTSDSCTTDNEEDLFTYQNEYNLITLGWIHTHPSQTAFLSSVDLHTHYSYQLMMSEAIAIVCAPRYSQTGFFQLTPHYGLDFIANCQQKGFHPHPSDPPLFQEADHCELDDNATIEVVDLRR